jgi:hypothetical protein
MYLASQALLRRAADTDGGSSTYDGRGSVTTALSSGDEKGEVVTGEEEGLVTRWV